MTYTLLDDLKHYRVNLKDVENILYDKNMIKLPSILKQLKIIIEFSDCII